MKEATKNKSSEEWSILKFLFKNLNQLPFLTFSTFKTINWGDSKLVIWKLVPLVPVLPKMTQEQRSEPPSGIVTYSQEISNIDLILWAGKPCTKSEILHRRSSSIRKLLISSDLIVFNFTRNTVNFMGNRNLDVSLTQKTAKLSQKVFSHHIFILL